MRVRILTIVLSLMTVISVSGQTNSKKNNPVGNWQFEAPSAPYGYTQGNLNVSFKDKKYTAIMSFPGNDYQLPGDKIKADGDNFSFTTFAEGQEVQIQLKMEGNSKMSGKVIHSDGEIPLDLTRVAEKK